MGSTGKQKKVHPYAEDWPNKPLNLKLSVSKICKIRLDPRDSWPPAPFFYSTIRYDFYASVASESIFDTGVF